jgi:hypothetical protein
MVMDRAQGSVRQEVLFASLPSGTVLLSEAWTANRSVRVTRVEQGFLRIINETFNAWKGNCNGYRDLHTPGRTDRFEGGVSADPNSDRIEIYDHPRWINIDGRMGIVFKGTGETVYHNRHYYPTWRAVADDLILGRIERPLRAARGRCFAEMTALLAPGCRAGKTADLRIVSLAGPKQSAALIAEDHLAAANFAAQSHTLSFSASRNRFSEIPIFPGVTRASSRRVTVRLQLHPGAAALQKARAHALVEGAVEFTSADTGSIVVRNTGRVPAKIRMRGDRRRKTIGVGRMLTL